MRILTLCLTVFLLVSSSAYSKDYFSSQLTMIRKEFRLDFDFQNVLITFKEKKNLSAKIYKSMSGHVKLVNPLRRNSYINKKYYNIGETLSKCIFNSDDKQHPGNWYHFAVWASLSAREVISGDKFKELSWAESFAAQVAGSSGIVLSLEEQKELFADVNVQIAWEMVPLGEEFLRSFCFGNKDFSLRGNKFKNLNYRQKKFFSLFKKQNKKNVILLKLAFKEYAKAIIEKDISKKVQYITLASIYQVLSEQLRVDGALHLSLMSKVLSSSYSKECTAKALYKIGNSNECSIYRLDSDVKVGRMCGLLENISYSRLRELLNTYKLPTKICEGDFYPKTACMHWESYKQRSKFLIALFISNMTNNHLRDDPYPERKIDYFEVK